MHIEFTEGEDKILVEGPPEEVDQAVKALQEFVQDLVSICVQFFTNLAIDFNGYYPNLLILLIKGYGKNKKNAYRTWYLFQLNLSIYIQLIIGNKT